MGQSFGVIFPTVRIFSLYEKRVVRIMAGAQRRPSCRSLFKQLELIPIPCPYIVSSMNFIVNNQEIF